MKAMFQNITGKILTMYKDLLLKGVKDFSYNIITDQTES